MKHYKYFFLILVFISVGYSFVFGQDDTRVYIAKAISNNCSYLNGNAIQGYKLCLIPKGKTEIPVVMCEYSSGTWFSEYNDEEKIKILEELLSFEGDTSICSKKVCNYGSKKFKKPKTLLYSTQIDALYLFTNFVVSSYAPTYCPFPVIYDKVKKKEVNFDQHKISEIFKLYRVWLANLKLNGSAKFKVPLNDSRFEWFGTQSFFGYYKENFWIYGIYPSGRVTGVCVD